MTAPWTLAQVHDPDGDMECDPCLMHVKEAWYIKDLGALFCESCLRQLIETCKAFRFPGDEVWKEEVRSVIANGKLIEAIKICRKRTGMSLKDAKDAIDSMRGIPPRGRI